MAIGRKWGINRACWKSVKKMVMMALPLPRYGITRLSGSSPYGPDQHCSVARKKSRIVDHVSYFAKVATSNRRIASMLAAAWPLRFPQIPGRHLGVHLPACPVEMGGFNMSSSAPGRFSVCVCRGLPVVVQLQRIRQASLWTYILVCTGIGVDAADGGRSERAQ